MTASCDLVEGNQIAYEYLILKQIYKNKIYSCIVPSLFFKSNISLLFWNKYASICRQRELINDPNTIESRLYHD